MIFSGEPTLFFCRRCGMFLGVFDKRIVIKCSICGLLNTQVKGKINFFERKSPQLKKKDINKKIKEFQDFFKYGREEKN